MANTAQHTNTCTISKSSKILYACLLGEITKIQTNQSDEQQFLFLFPSICEQKSLKSSQPLRRTLPSLHGIATYLKRYRILVVHQFQRYLKYELFGTTVILFLEGHQGGYHSNLERAKQTSIK